MRPRRVVACLLAVLVPLASVGPAVAPALAAGDIRLNVPRIASAPVDATAMATRAYLQMKAGDLDGARATLLEWIALDPSDYVAHAMLGDVYVAKNDLSSALKEFQLALKTAPEKYAKDLKEKIKEVQDVVLLRSFAKDTPTNDEYAFVQYYLKTLNLPEAWANVPSPAKAAVVAVIDDGVNVNHPDLVGHIWTNSKEMPGNGIDDDKNGYVDDFNGWNFAEDDAQALWTAGTHGTMVAGIIGALQNNKVGIAGVAKDVKIMPLRVFSGRGGGSPEWVISAIGYAVDNGADVINLSLGGTQFAYSADSDFILKEATRMGVMVVIAAGNGDELSLQSAGVDTTVNKLSPLCNGAGLDAVVGVGSSDGKGVQSKWSNYGSCVNFFAPGEEIWSTAVSLYNSGGKPYKLASGTSFSAPMVTGLIALGINKYGRQAPLDVRAALNAAYVADAAGNKVLDAKKYLDALGEQVAKAAVRGAAAARTAALSPVETSMADRFAATYRARAKATGTPVTSYADLLRKMAARAYVHARVRALADAIADRLQ